MWSALDIKAGDRRSSRAAAVLRLTTSSKRGGRSPAMSAARAPRTRRPTVPARRRAPGHPVAEGGEEPGDVAGGSREALRETAADRGGVGGDGGDRDRVRRGARRGGGRVVAGD